ncbi:hypothetical protein CRG98_024575 [Punica granatum]|uniref:Uncharacterized protein n=1 Tax=Punica granatum TaxID=22663 RepID=A0A2I0JFK4_PUNGR|nr:hypothetical protein CRG98_024575 [Punica granatum]
MPPPAKPKPQAATCHVHPPPRATPITSLFVVSSLCSSARVLLTNSSSVSSSPLVKLSSQHQLLRQPPPKLQSAVTPPRAQFELLIDPQHRLNPKPLYVPAVSHKGKRR